MIECETCGTEFEYVHTAEEVEAMEGLNARSQLAFQSLVKCPKCANQRNLTKKEIVKLFLGRLKLNARS